MLMSIIVFLVIGLIAGWLAGIIWKGGGFGLVGNLIIGVIGAFLGGFLLRVVGFHYGGFIGQVVAAVIGALVLLFIISLVKK